VLVVVCVVAKALAAMVMMNCDSSPLQNRPYNIVNDTTVLL